LRISLPHGRERHDHARRAGVGRARLALTNREDAHG
jgi:hypothetical protein